MRRHNDREEYQIFKPKDVVITTREQDKEICRPFKDHIALGQKDQTLRCNGRLSTKGRRVDALALRAEERRDKLR